jgi:hypothetical protein
MLSNLFNACSAQVASGYQTLGHSLGYRFMTGPRATLAKSTQIALITLNPGGGSESARQSGASLEEGSSYVVESWVGQAPGQAKLQQQVQALFREIMDHAGVSGDVGEYLARDVLTAHLIPFRSPSLATLTNKENSIRFATKLWTRILSEWRPRLIVTIDQLAYAETNQIIYAMGGNLVELERFDTGWGNYQAEAVRYVAYAAGGNTTIARLPHLSRFTLFTEPGYSTSRKDRLRPFFAWITAGLSKANAG